MYSTGITTTVRDFISKAFLVLGIHIEFKGEKENELGIVTNCPNEYNFLLSKIVVVVDKNYYRPTEVDLLIGDASKANKMLGWKPKYTLDELISEMILSDLKNEQ